MNYILIGLLLSIGWQIAKLFFEIVSEIIFMRLHKTKWYTIAVGKRSIKSKKDTSTIKLSRIGF